MNNVIEVKGLKKNYGTHAVLKGVDLTVKAGEIFALLGTNGAGKTTSLECMEGLRAYDGGSVSVRGKIGIQLQSSALQANIKPMEAVRLFARWNGCAIDENMLHSLAIDQLHGKYAELSTGQKRRLHLALALLPNPDIIFLDEPTAGLDVEGRISLHEQIRALKNAGKTIVLASHDMSEVEALCDEIALLKDGKIIFNGSVEEFTAIGGRHVVRIVTDQGVERYETDDITKTIWTLFQNYREQGISVSEIQTEKASLEERFMKFTRGNP